METPLACWMRLALLLQTGSGFGGESPRAHVSGSSLDLPVYPYGGFFFFFVTHGDSSSLPAIPECPHSALGPCWGCTLDSSFTLGKLYSQHSEQFPQESMLFKESLPQHNITKSRSHLWRYKRHQTLLVMFTQAQCQRLPFLRPPTRWPVGGDGQEVFTQLARGGRRWFPQEDVTGALLEARSPRPWQTRPWLTHMKEGGEKPGSTGARGDGALATGLAHTQQSLFSGSVLKTWKI